ncbi:MAG: glycosyltransferase [Bacillota bacterium]|nr:glycosyltransferase [Bacillota bacterium]
MRVAWLLDIERAPQALVTVIARCGRALARRGHEVGVFGTGGAPPWWPEELPLHTVTSFRVAPESLWHYDVAIATHWSQVGAVADAWSAAPLLLVTDGFSGGGEQWDVFTAALRSLPVGILSGSDEMVARLQRAGVAGKAHIYPALWDSGNGVGMDAEIAGLEAILAEVVAEHRSRIRADVTLGLAMIVRDERESLQRCLASAAPVVDQMVVVDTGSQDDSASVALQAGATVVRHQWQNDFAAARNAGLQQLTTDWVLVLDADEELTRASAPLIRRAIRNPLVGGFLIDMVSFEGDVTISGASCHAGLRLFRRLPGVQFEGALHEQVAPSLLRAHTCIRPLPGVSILHYGYLGATVEAYDKKRRNLEIARRQAEAEPQNSFVHYNLGVEYARRGEWSKAVKELQRAFRLLRSPYVPYATALVRHLATCLMHLGRHHEALDVLERARAVYPGFVDLDYLQGLTLNRLGRYEEALEILNRCQEKGDSPGIYMGSQVGAGSFLARAATVESYLGLGQLDEAVAAHRTAAQEMAERLGGAIPNPSRSASRALTTWAQAEEHVRAGRLQDALRAFRELLDPGVRQALLTTQLSQLLPRKVVLELAAGDPCLVWQDLGLLAGVNPGAARAASLLLEPWLPSFCGVEQERALPADPTRVSDGVTPQLRWSDVAVFLTTMLDVGREDWFQRALERLCSGLMDPGELDRELGKLYLRRGLRSRAATHLLSSVQRGCADSHALCILGEISSDLGLAGEARTFFREAIRRQPRDSRPWVSLARAYHAIGRSRWGLRILELARRHTGGNAIQVARLALSIDIQVAQSPRVAVSPKA